MAFWDFLFPNNDFNRGPLLPRQKSGGGPFEGRTINPTAASPLGRVFQSPTGPGTLSGSMKGFGFNNRQGLLGLLGITNAFDSVANKFAPKQTTTADIMARLEALQDPSRFMPDENSLEIQARSGAEAQYGPLIAALRQQMAGAEQRAGKDKEALGQMFGALSADLADDIPGLQQQYAQTKQSVGGEYDQLKGMITDQYANSQAEQEAMLKRLNIEAAGAETLPQQQRDRDYFVNLASKEGQTAQTALGMEERGTTEFTRRGSELAKVEGTNRQANLMEQLREAMDVYQSQIGAHEAAQSNAYTSGLASLQQQASQSASQAAQREFENYIKATELGRALRSDELKASGTFPQAVKSPGDIAGRALGLGLGQPSAQSLQDVFLSAVGSNEMLQGGIDERTGAPMTSEAKAAQIVEQGRQAGLSGPELNILQTMALEYFGRR